MKKVFKVILGAAAALGLLMMFCGAGAIEYENMSLLKGALLLFLGLGIFALSYVGLKKRT